MIKIIRKHLVNAQNALVGDAMRLRNEYAKLTLKDCANKEYLDALEIAIIDVENSLEWVKSQINLINMHLEKRQS